MGKNKLIEFLTQLLLQMSTSLVECGGTRLASD